HTPYEELVYGKKKLIMEQHMAGDVDNLAHLLKQISSQDRHGSDITLTSLKKALIEICAAFPIYRTYVHRDPPDPADRLYITRAIQKARERNPALQHELSFMERFLLLRFGDYLQEEERKAWLHFLMRFQQLTAPLMAKGFEDTTLYVYNRLLSLNEVGGEPQRFGTTLEEWHRFNRERAARWPHALNATATHDTKRGEDVRARLNVLSEIPDTWEKQLRLWSRLNRRKKRMVRGRPVPDRNDEYFLYQTLLGALPFRAEEYPSFQERLKAYIVKAVREAKVYTAWLKPDTAYEEAFLAFIDAILSPSPRNRFWPALLSFHRQIAFYGIWNGLSQTLLKLTAPGVPDFYQGTEFWDLNLVDPDNRRPVDFDRRKAVLQEIKGKGPDQRRGLLAELLQTREDGRIKLFLIGKGLEVRQSRPALFARGAYIPVEVEGRWREHIIAFARHWQEEWAISVAPRFLTSLIPLGTLPLGIPVWGDTHLRLPAGAPTLWQEAFSTQPIRGASLLVGEILQHFPVALLVNKERG
ncbi:MAG: malto-oligosyltrehalose synthase, partial [Nitrospinota bacterium]